jgi:hypothetical protein
VKAVRIGMNLNERPDMSSVPLRPRSPFFSFDAETGSKRPRWYVFLASLLALALGLITIVVGVTSASAHNKEWDASCFGGWVSLTFYNDSQANTVSVKVDGQEQASPEQQVDFGTTFYTEWNWDPAVAHTIEIHVNGWDGYDLDVAKKTIPPCTLPTAGLQSTVCNTTGGTTDVTATFSGFASYKAYAETYTGVLKNENNVVVGTLPNLQTIAGGTYTWTGLEAGHVYTFTVTGNTHATLTASTTSTVVGCPQLKDFAVTPQVCNSTTGNNGGVTVAATVTPGRAYTIIVTNGTTTYGTYNVLASNASASISVTIPLAENLTNLQVIMTDDLAPNGDQNKVRESIKFSTGPCPKVPTEPTIVPSVCTEVGGSLTISVTLNGLVPTRSYTVSIDGTVVDTIVAGGTTHGGLTYPVTAGSHTVSVTDTLVAGATVTSPAFMVEACPTDPGISFDIAECSVPGGKGTITATFTNLGAGREYTVTITGDGSSVPGYVAPLTVTSTTPPTVYSNLTPSVLYTVTIVDKLAPAILDAKSATLEACPMTPKIGLTLQCLLFEGDSLITATIDDLKPGAQYLVEISDDSVAPIAGGGAAAAAAGAPVAAQTITAGATPATVTFQVPNNLMYTVKITALSNAAITNTAQIFAAICDLPTFDFPPELPTLALTGADTTMPMLGALGLVQFGVALLALAAMLQFAPRRRNA